MSQGLTWLEIEPLVQQLCCSKRNIYEFKSKRLLKPGIHFYAAGVSGEKGRHVYSLELVRDVLLEQTAKAAKLKVKSKSIRPIESYDDGDIDGHIRGTQ